MSHRNARLTPKNRRTIIEHVLAGRPMAAHAAKEMGISRTCAHRWISRYRAHGWDGLEDRSSRPKSCRHATPAKVVSDVLTKRVEYREGPTDLAVRRGTSAWTVFRILFRAGMPRLWDLDPVTGNGSGLRGQRTAAINTMYPATCFTSTSRNSGGSPKAVAGWPTLDRTARITAPQTKLGFDYVHVAVDDHTPLAYAEVLPDEKGPTCAGFLTRAAASMAANGAPVRQVMRLRT